MLTNRKVRQTMPIDDRTTKLTTTSVSVCHSSSTTEEPIPLPGSVRKACSRRGYITQPASRVETTDRIQRLRIEMSRDNSVQDKPLDAYLITSDDEHQVGTTFNNYFYS